MAKTTTTVRAYPKNSNDLDSIRRWLQAQDGGADKTMADAIEDAIKAWRVLHEFCASCGYPSTNKVCEICFAVKE